MVLKEPTMNTIVKNGKKIIGFAFEHKGEFFYAFGKPSQSNYLSFKCNSIEEGVEKIKTIKADTDKMIFG